MSNLCWIGGFEGIENLPLEVKQDLIDMWEKEDLNHICLEANDIHDGMNLNFEDDPTGEISDWARKHKIEFSYYFNDYENPPIHVVYTKDKSIESDDDTDVNYI